MYTQRLSIAAAVLGVMLLASPARAQDIGFTINRYEPTNAGEWSFSVDHPWYSRTRYFAGGLTFNYGHNPLIYGPRQANGDIDPATIALRHQFLAHFDLAGSVYNRVTFSLSLPVTLLERGSAVGGFAPLSGGAGGDPRLGIFVRLFGEPDASPFSVSAAVQAWIPVGLNERHAGDRNLRLLPKIILGGLAHSVRWSFTGGFYYRPEARVGSIPAAPSNSTGSEFQLGGALYYANQKHRFAVGPEMLFGTVVLGAGDPFRRATSSLELQVIGVHYNIAKLVQIGAAWNLGLLRQAGTPDYRLLFRVAYAPIRGPQKARPKVVDSDGDGIPDDMDRCPTQAQGPHPDPDPARKGCPAKDSDGDGIFDDEDLCPMEAASDHPDPARKGCPAKDSDGDGVYDDEDLCPSEPAGAHPDPTRKGCPDKDSDGDGIYDHDDACPQERAGLHPDPSKPGCPLPDRDQDQVPDPEDACPDKAGAPDPNPKKNGCPGLVTVRQGQLVILQQVHFATGKDTILPKSFPVLQAVANALKAQPQIKRVSVDGHTDNVGKPDKNKDLSDRRAQSVMRWLVAHGIDAERLEAHGYGQERPIADNQTASGRGKNRRVEFNILDPAPTTH